MESVATGHLFSGIIPDQPVTEFRLRPYQIEANAEISDAFLSRQVGRQLIVVATGGGKTEIFARTASEPSLAEWLETFPESHRQILVIAHRKELISQAAAKIRRASPELLVEVEKAESVASDDADVIVASVQTLSAMEGRRIGKFDPERVRLVIVDEAHHAIGESYQKVLRYFGFLPPPEFMADTPDLRDTDAALAWQRRRLESWDAMNRPNRLLLGVTATPIRGDNVGLEAVFAEVTFKKDLRDLIREGYLCRPRAIKVASATSLDEISTRDGDFATKELAGAVDKTERTLLALKAYKEHAEGRKFVGFAVDVNHAYHSAEVFNEAGVKCAVIHANVPEEERNRLYNELAHGELMGLFNVMVLTEGWDEPRVSCAIMLRPTKSGLLYQQCVGRILRLFDGKDDALIIDVVDVTRRHSLVTSTDLFGLPAGFNPNGQDLERLATRVEQIKAENPFLRVDNFKDIDDLEMHVESVDLFAMEPAEEVRQMAKLNWLQLDQGCFQFHYRGQEWAEHLELRRGPLGAWDCFVTEGLKNERRIGTFHDLPTAFSKAENWLFSQNSEAFTKGKHNAPWRKFAPSDAQIRYAKRLGIDVDYTQIRQGQISDLINAKLAKAEQLRKRQHQALLERSKALLAKRGRNEVAKRS